MADYSDLAAATQAVADPATSGADLAQIASWHAKLHLQVAIHANADAELLTWLGANSDDATRQVAAARLAAVEVDEPEPLPEPRHLEKPSRWSLFGHRAAA